MSDIVLDEQSAPATPAAGQGVIYIDSTTSKLSFVDDSGRDFIMTGGGMTNASVANQAVTSADTYLTDSDLLIPSFGLQAKTRIVWTCSMSKTAAGTATPIYQVRIGSTRTVTDTSRLTLTGPAQTAIADIGCLNVMLTVRTVGAAGVIQGTAWFDHRGTAASTTVSGVGFANDTTGHVEGTAAGFDMSALGGLFIGLSVNSGTLGIWTVTQVHARMD